MTVAREDVETESAPVLRLEEAGLPRGRYAPSPSGDLHLGNLATALLAWLSIRSRQGTFVIRMEDLDQPRVRPGAADGILRDLAWAGLDWDEGPDCGGPFAPYEQSRRSDHYNEAFDRLREAGRVYLCFCSRKDIASAATAPQTPGDEIRYPGTCRELDPSTVAGYLREGKRHAWRFRVEESERPSFVDKVRSFWGVRPQEPPADFVVRRSDGVTAYQLASVVDDSTMKMSEVVRGQDLLPSTLRQILLYEALEFPLPAFGHTPLFLGPDGERLSKRHEGITVGELRDQGLSAAEIVGRLACLLGLCPEPAPVSPTGLLESFTFGDLVDAPDGIVADPSGWLPIS
jgi:glutamyl-tRNA synthetase